jgi:hypothetical protein
MKRLALSILAGSCLLAALLTFVMPGNEARRQEDLLKDCLMNLSTIETALELKRLHVTEYPELWRVSTALTPDVAADMMGSDDGVEGISCHFRNPSAEDTGYDIWLLSRKDEATSSSFIWTNRPPIEQGEGTSATFRGYPLAWDRQPHPDGSVTVLLPNEGSLFMEKEVFDDYLRSAVIHATAHGIVHLPSL